MAEYRDRFAELTSLGLGLAALSVDGKEPSRALADQQKLPFPLLCDPSREVVQAYGLYNRAEKGGIAYPATFVLDRDRRVRFRSLDRLASRVDLDGLFAFLRGGEGATAPAKPAQCKISPRLAEIVCVTKNALKFGIRSPRG